MSVPVSEKVALMSDDELCYASATEIRNLYKSRKASPVDVVTASVDRIKRLNPILNSFVYLAEDQALAGAKVAEAKIMAGETVPLLEGIPLSVKDNIMTSGIRSTLGSLLFKDYVPEEDSGVVARLKGAGAIVLGKTNTPAFGWTGTTDNKVFGPTPNPYDARLTAGGSSGGAAVSAATALATLNIGTDGGGSIRTPAAFTGTVGFKPSHGRLPDVPAHTHWLLQHYGPVARTVKDVALVLQAGVGSDPRDPHSLPDTGEDFFAATEKAPPRQRVLFTTQLGFTEAIDPEVASVCRNAMGAFRELGWEVKEQDLAWPDPAPFANVLAAVGLAARLKGYTDRTDEIETGILNIIESTKSLPPHAFYDAYVERNKWCVHPFELFETIDLLVTPTVGVAPFQLGKLFPESIGSRTVSPAAWSPFLRCFNLTGQPAISVPAGTTRAGLPVGIQIVGPRFGDAKVLAAAASFERQRPWPVRWTPDQMKNC